MTIIVTVGDATANSYVTSLEVDAYAVGTFNAAAWAGLTPTQKEACLIRSTRLLDTMVVYRGEKVTTTQARQFPRYGIPIRAGTYTGYVVYGSYYDSTIIPQCVKDAQAELATFLATQLTATSDPFAVTDTSGISSLSVGPISIDFRATAGAEGVNFFDTFVLSILETGGVVEIGPRLVR